LQDKLKKLDYENSIGLIARNAFRSLEKALDVELLRKYGISGGQWRVIGALAVSNGITQKEVADLIYLDTSTLVPILDKLEKLELVQRKLDPKDRRNKRIFLTEKSESIIDSIVDAVLNMRRSVYKNIPVQDMDTAKQVLRKIMENVEIFISEKPSEIKKKS
jgi:MarR family transcriptional regulator for hemolysin